MCSLPPFLAKTYEMVNDPSTDSVVSWSPSNKSFLVHNPQEFTRYLLPRYFTHGNFSSFIRQLNTYGFRKIDPEKWEFTNDDFLKGQLRQLKNIHRRKPVHSHSLKNQESRGSSSPLTEKERQELKEEIERLKNDEEAIDLDLEKHEQERESFEMKMQSLKDRFLKIEQRQKNMVSYLNSVLDKQGLALNLLLYSRSSDKKRRLPRSDHLNDKTKGEEGDRMETSESTGKESIDGSSPILKSILDLCDLLESSLTIWENVVMAVGQRITGCAMISDFEETTSCADSPVLSSIQLNLELRPRSHTIDMNSQTSMAATHEIPKTPAVSATQSSITIASGPVSSKERAAGPPVAPMRTDTNDVFWLQVLTENPGSLETQEVQSQRKDSSERSRSESNNPGEMERFCRGSKSVNNLAEQLGNLTPAEET